MDLQTVFVILALWFASSVVLGMVLGRMLRARAVIVLRPVRDRAQVSPLRARSSRTRIA
jgi:hypothetical protein